MAGRPVVGRRAGQDQTFAGPGEIYVKLLPDGEPVQLTHDRSNKMSPAFSPGGDRITYFPNPSPEAAPLISPAMTNAGYDPQKDFAPIAITAVSVSALMVHESLPVTTLRLIRPTARLALPGGQNWRA